MGREAPSRPPSRLVVKLTHFTALAAIVAALSACSDRTSVYRFRYAHAQPAHHPRSESMLFFERELEQRTGGLIQVENYFSGVLGDEREMMDMVATGVLQGTRGGLFVDANRKYSLFLLPFLVEDWDQALRLMVQ